MTSRRSQGDGTLFKRADGMYIGRVELPPDAEGNRRQKQVSSRDRNTAMAKWKKLRAAVEAGQVPTAPSTTVERWMNYWLESILPGRKVRTGTISPGTITSYANTIRLYINPHIGAKRIDKLTPADIRALYRILQTTATRRSEAGSTRNAQKADQVLRLALKSAVREGVLGIDIMDRVDKPAHAAAEQIAFSAETSMHILSTAFSSRDETWAVRWALGFFTGLRESEILGLEWDRVDFDRGVLDVSWQLQRLKKVHGCGDPADKVYPCGMKRTSFCPQARWDFPPGMEYRLCERTLVWTRPKSAAGRRIVPIIPELATELRRLEAVDSPNPHNLVLHHTDGSPITQDQDQKAWRALLKAAGVPHVPQHSVRHSTVTLLTKYGVPAHIIKSVIGHTDITTTQGYIHDDIEDAQVAWNKLGAIMPATK